MKNKTETTYVKMCTTCLQQENGITHKLTEYVLGVKLDIGFKYQIIKIMFALAKY